MPDFTREELERIKGCDTLYLGHAATSHDEFVRAQDVAAFTLQLMDEYSEMQRDYSGACREMNRHMKERAKDVEALRLAAKFDITRPCIELAQEACLVARARLAAWEGSDA